MGIRSFATLPKNKLVRVYTLSILVLGAKDVGTLRFAHPTHAQMVLILLTFNTSQSVGFRMLF